MKTFSQQEAERALIAITQQLLVESGETSQREIKLNLSLQHHLGIDSLARAELFRRIEKQFNVTLSDQTLAEVDTLQDIVDHLLQDSEQVRIIKTDKVNISHKPAAVLPSTASSLIDVLMMYAEQTPEKPHIYFQQEDGKEYLLTYGELLDKSLRLAQALLEKGLQRHETVAIMQPTSLHFFFAFFGTLLAGGIPVPIYPPFRAHMLESYAKTEARILRNAEVRMLLTFDRAELLSYLLKGLVPSLKYVGTVGSLLQSEKIKSPHRPTSTDFAFIQYTSGSTSDPKGVLLSHYNLLSNIRAYAKSVNITKDSVAVSWLPLYHDMGLIGMWLGSLYLGIPLVLMTPFSFLNRPEKWLWAIHRYRGTHSGAPNFAYELCVRKIEPYMIEGLDLSSWQLAANGAEKVYPRTLIDFVNKFKAYGFKAESMMPVYGLAESSVALAIPEMGKMFRIDRVDRKLFEEKCQAVPVAADGLEFAACGKPIVGHEVQIVDENNHVLPERSIGRLQFRGPSSMQGYYHNEAATKAVLHDGWIDSGDLAYLADGDIFITGRRKDLIIKAGRNLYPAEIEEMVGNVSGVRQGCVAAFGITNLDRGTEQLIVVAETREKNKTAQEKIRAEIQETISNILDIVPDHIILVKPRTVPKTSSGKLQRAACKQMYLNHTLGKSQIPAWLQIVKVSTASFISRIQYAIKKIAQAFYSLYMALIFSLTLLPVWLLVKILSRDKAARITKQWSKFLIAVSFCPVKYHGLQHLVTKNPVIYTANHASYVDSFLMLSILPIETRIVGKKELLQWPFMKTFFKKLDYIAIDRVDLPKGIEDTKQINQALDNGFSILIYPEGTFSYAAGLRPFRLGAFKIAAETNHAICPIAIKGTRNILRADEKLLKPARIVVTVDELIESEDSEWEDVITLRNKTREIIAKYCGEPSLDYIAAQPVAVSRKQDKT